MVKSNSSVDSGLASYRFAPWKVVGDTRVVAGESSWKKPLKWDRETKAAGVRRRVFCASMADVFEDWQGPMLSHEGYPLRCMIDGTWGRGGIIRNDFPLLMADVRARLFSLIDATPSLDWLLLTKRPENIAASLTQLKVQGHRCAACGSRKGEPHGRDGLSVRCSHRPNVWLGTTIENQQTADERIPHLLRVPARVRFLSCEPLLGPVDLTNICGARGLVPDYLNVLTGIEYPSSGHKPVQGPHAHWVIAGGESGPHARPMHPDWVRGLRDQCVAAGVPFWFDSWGEWRPATPDESAIPLPFGSKIRKGPPIYCCANPDMEKPDECVARVGKASAGRVLDGRECSEVPA